MKKFAHWCWVSDLDMFCMLQLSSQPRSAVGYTQLGALSPSERQNAPAPRSHIRRSTRRARWGLGGREGALPLHSCSMKSFSTTAETDCVATPCVLSSRTGWGKFSQANNMPETGRHMADMCQFLLPLHVRGGDKVAEDGRPQ